MSSEHGRRREREGHDERDTRAGGGRHATPIYRPTRIIGPRTWTRRTGRLRGCHPVDMQTVYEAMGGANGVLRLAEAWHARVLADEEVSHAFSHGFHPQHTQRLAAYWAEALGGPRTYSTDHGDEASVVR